MISPLSFLGPGFQYPADRLRQCPFVHRLHKEGPDSCVLNGVLNDGFIVTGPKNNWGRGPLKAEPNLRLDTFSGRPIIGVDFEVTYSTLEKNRREHATLHNDEHPN
jgi:hypothetical protein